MDRNTKIRGFGDRLRAERKRMGLSQRALADAAETKWTCISALENGRRYPGLDLAARLANALEISVDSLIQAKT